MAVYSIYLPPDIGTSVLDKDRARAVFLPDTRSVWALIIPAVWLAWNRLWLPLAVYIAIAMAFVVIANQWNAQLALLLSGLPGLYLFLEGNELIRLKHEREGWLFDGVLEAPDRPTAELRYFSGGAESRPVQTGLRQSAAAPHFEPPLATTPSSLFPE